MNTKEKIMLEALRLFSQRGYDAVRRAATLCLPHILHGDTVDRGCSYL